MFSTRHQYNVLFIFCVSRRLLFTVGLSVMLSIFATLRGQICRLSAYMGQNNQTPQGSYRRQQCSNLNRKSLSLVIQYSVSAPSLYRWPRIAMQPPTEKQVKCRYAFAIIGVLVGLSVGVIFAIVFHNPDTAAWGLASGRPTPILLSFDMNTLQFFCLCIRNSVFKFWESLDIFMRANHDGIHTIMMICIGLSVSPSVCSLCPCKNSKTTDQKSM